MGQVVSHVYKTFKTLKNWCAPTPLHKKLLIKLDQMLLQTTSEKQVGALLTFRAAAAANVLNMNYFIPRLGLSFPEFTINSGVSAKLSLLKSMETSKEVLLKNLKDAPEKFSVQEIDALEKLIEQYLPQAYAKSYLFYTQALGILFQSNFDLDSLQNILDDEHCLEQFEMGAVNNNLQLLHQKYDGNDTYKMLEPFDELIQYLDEKLAVHKMPELETAPKAVARRWVE